MFIVLSATVFGQGNDSQCGDFRLRNLELVGISGQADMSVVADFNNDAIPDIATPITFLNSVAISIGRKGGGFESYREFLVGVSPQEAITGDFNRDGEIDLAITSELDGQVNILMGDGLGNFADSVSYPVGGVPDKLDKGDFNNDGWLDLVVANTSFPNRGLTVYLGGPEGFSAATIPNIPTDERPVSVRTADFNLDGKLDFAVAIRFTGPNSQVVVYSGDGLGGFTLATTVTVPELYDMGVADFDGDGAVDIATPSYRDNFTRVFLNDHAGGFGAPRQIPSSASTVLVAVDINSDGFTDISLGGTVLVNDGAANFTVVDAGLPRIAAFGDFNGDGILDFSFFSDITSTNGSTNSFYLGIAYGRGGFKFDLGSALPGLAGATNGVIADFNGDGRQDVAGALGYTIGVRLALQNVDGTFSPTATVPYSGSGTANQLSDLISADVNSDGSPDLITHVNWARSMVVLINNGSGQFTQMSYNTGLGQLAAYRPIETGDFNGDGKIDAVVSAQNGYKIYLNDGMGQFTPMQTVSITASLAGPSAVADFDGDGQTDFIFSRGSQPLILYHGNGDGTFAASTQFPVQGFVTTIRKADLNADGRADFVVGTGIGASMTPGLIQTFKNRSTAPFEIENYSVSTAPSDVRLGDFNGDSKQDILAFNSPNSYVTLMAGNGTGGIASQVSVPATGNMFAGAVGDVNDDGFSDVVAGGAGVSFVMLFNETSTRPCLSAADITVTEGNTGSVNADFTISLSAASTQNVSVDYRVVGRNAVRGVDFTNITGTLQFAPGSTTQTVQVPVAGDLLDEYDETFQLVLANPVNAAVIDKVATATIADNDAIPSVTGVDASVVEGTGATPTRTTAVLTLSAVSGRPTTVAYSLQSGTAVAGTDFTARTGFALIAPGQSTAEIPIDLTADAFSEPNEMLSVVLSNPVNLSIVDNESIVTIINDDFGGTVRFAAQSVIVNESDETATLTVTRTGGAAAGVVISYAVTGGTATPNRDFLPVSGKLLFNAGESTKTIVVPLLDDVVDEPSTETINLALTAVSGGVEVGSPAATSVEISDDDAPPAITAQNISVAEGDSGSTNAIFTVRLQTVSELSVSVGYQTSNGTAIAPADYLAATGNLTFAPGETSKTITVSIVGERSRETDESFHLDFSAPINGVLTTSRVTATIVNDDNGSAVADFDGDGRTDLSIFRPSVGEWWYSRSIDGQVPALQFGGTGDKIAYGDFTGDGKADITFWRPSTGEWFVLRSEDSSYFSFPFGAAGDIPATGDYDGDGKSDVAVYRPSTGTWFIQNSSGSGISIVQFGSSDDKPVNADFDGDGKSDIAIFRPSDGSWWYSRSSDGGFRVFRFGVGTDRPVPGDFTGDGKADIAVFRSSTGEWFVQRSEDNSYFSFPFGASGDIAVPGDYDGDGKFDAGVFRPSSATWFVNRTTAGVLIATFGSTGDVPLPGSLIQ